MKSLTVLSLSKYLALNHLIEHCLTSDNKWNDYESELIEIISSLDDGGDDLDIYTVWESAKVITDDIILVLSSILIQHKINNNDKYLFVKWVDNVSCILAKVNTHEIIMENYVEIF